MQEGQGLELKKSVSNDNDLGQCVCAFANTAGGTVIVGVGDDGKVTGIDESKLDEVQLRISGAVQCVSPVPLHRILLDTMEGKKIIKIEVRSMAPDSFCTHHGLIYVRSGSANLRMEGAAMMQFLTDREVLRYDSRLSQESMDDLDEVKIREYMRQRSPLANLSNASIADLLFNLGVADRDGRIRNAAVLMFSKSPQRAVPQCEVRLARFAGRERVRVLDSQFVNGTILENLAAAESFIMRNIRIGHRIEGMIRKDVPEYPVSAIRELLINALVHRDYFDCNAVQVSIFEDRLEIANPGKLLPGLSLEDIGALSKQRNPLLYGLLRELRLLEGMATGIPKVKASMRDAGLPEPLFQEIGGFFKVTLLGPSCRELLVITERQKKVLRMVEEKGEITTGEVSFALSVSSPTAYNDLQALDRAGYLLRQGKGRGSHYVLIR